MPEPWTMHHEKQFIKRLKPHLIPGYRTGLALRWYGMSEDRELMSLDERIELLSALTAREMALYRANPVGGNATDHQDRRSDARA